MAEQYWVIGGVYTSTEFNCLADGKSESKSGPFDTYDQAKTVWRAKSMEYVDEAFARFRIENEQNHEWWVTGGSYTNTDFKTIASGGEEERLGPFASYEAAREAWWEKSSAGIDDAYCRYRIEQL